MFVIISKGAVNGIAIISVSITIVVMFTYQAPKVYMDYTIMKRNVPMKPIPKPKIILMYTNYFGKKIWDFIPEHFNFVELDGTPCKQRNCIVTYDKSKLKESNALLFHARDLPNPSNLRKMRVKDFEKIWIWHYLESPVNAFGNFARFSGLFNWTATYKSESEVHIPYFNVIPLSNTNSIPTPPLGKDFSKGKTKLVMAAISNCNSARINIVRALKQHVQFDLFGSCGRRVNSQIKNCPRFSASCERRFKKYKFYFSMENSFCSEYVTEKYFLNGLQNGLVPIVLGAANYQEIGPPHSFIEVLDFENMKSLAQYLKYLDKNNTAYNEYHQWRYTYKVVRNNRICETCKVLWERDSKNTSTALPDTGTSIPPFWNIKKDCKDWQNVLHRYM